MAKENTAENRQMGGAPWEIEGIENEIPEKMRSYYLGTSAEYLLMSSLSRKRYDVYKPVVDYGFDVIANTNAACKNGSTYYFQVKSANAYEDGDRTNRGAVTNRNGTRETLNAGILVSGYSLNLLKEKGSNAALIIYVFDEEKAGDRDVEDLPVTYFWLTYEDIINAQNYIFKDTLHKSDWQGGYYVIPVQIKYPNSETQSISIYYWKKTLKNGSKKGKEGKYSEDDYEYEYEYVFSQRDNPERFKLSAFLRNEA